MVAVTCALMVLALMLAWSVWRLLRPRASFMDHPVLFFLLVCGALLVLRLPQIEWYRELNPDESQMLAQGMRFLSHPVPWRDVDGTTGGPFNSLVLTLPMCFGAPATWQTARCVLWVLTCLTLLLLYLTLRCFGTRAEAQFALLPTVLFYALSAGADFAHYNSEALSVLLLSVGFYLLAKEWTSDKLSLGRLFFVGLVAGSIAFAKLQAAPLAVFLVLVGLALIVACHLRAGRSWRACWREAFALGLGTVAVPSLILGVVTLHGAWGDFWKSYILAGSYYVKEPVRFSQPGRTLFLGYTDATPFLVGTLAALGSLLWAYAASRVRLPGRLLWPLIVMLADGVLTAGCLLVSGKPFWHYLILFVPPFGLICGLVFFVGKTKIERRSGPGSNLPTEDRTEAVRADACPQRTLAFSVWLLVYSVCVAAIEFQRVPSFLRMTRYYSKSHTRKSLVADFVSRVSQPGDSLSVWGWMPVYYVETGLSPATREAVGHYQLSPGPYQSYFRHRYLEDLEQSRPAVFVDAVARGAFLGPLGKADKHEGFPELARFIAENYALWVDIKLAEGDSPVRLYILKERLVNHHPSPADPASPARAQ
jgi:hypothetical protein